MEGGWACRGLKITPSRRGSWDEAVRGAGGADERVAVALRGGRGDVGTFAGPGGADARASLTFIRGGEGFGDSDADVLGL